MPISRLGSKQNQIVEGESCLAELLFIKDFDSWKEKHWGNL